MKATNIEKKKNKIKPTRRREENDLIGRTRIVCGERKSENNKYVQFLLCSSSIVFLFPYIATVPPSSLHFFVLVELTFILLALLVAIWPPFVLPSNIVGRVCVCGGCNGSFLDRTCRWPVKMQRYTIGHRMLFATFTFIVHSNTPTST